MAPIAEVAFDLSYTEEKMWARIYPPEQQATREEWSCSFEIDAPISIQRTIYGVSSLQALVLALKTMALHIYGSDAYRAQQLGIDGEFGGNLSIPAPAVLLDIAPFPF